MHCLVFFFLPVAQEGEFVTGITGKVVYTLVSCVCWREFVCVFVCVREKESALALARARE